MFKLNKSLAKLKSALKDANLAENDPDSNVAKKPKKTKKNRKIAKKENDGNQKRGVIMIKNFPHGFYEKQMFGYFSQFGEVTRLKIVRSRKTGNPRSYGFIEFRFEDVAKIAAETMNNYLMFEHIVKCTLLPEDKVPKNLFRNWDRPFVSSIKSHKVNHNKEKSETTEYNLLCKRLRRVHKMEEELSKKGIEFKCVLVNRPTGLKPKSKSEIAESKLQKVPKQKPKIDRLKLKEIPTVPLETNLSSRNKLVKRKNKKLIVWKFVKLMAANPVRF